MSEDDLKLKIVGVDVSKGKLDIAFDNQKVISIANTESAFKTLPTLKNCCVVMEASGGYEQPFVLYLLNKNIDVAIVNAKRVRDFAKAMGIQAKNDSLDADVIRQYGEFAYNKNRLQIKDLRSDVEQKVESLLRRRHQLVELRMKEKQHLESACDAGIVSSIKRMIQSFDAEVKRIEEEIKIQISRDVELMKKIKRLKAVEGVGEICALIVASQLPELGKVSHKEIAALVGLAPYSRDSGKKSGRRVIVGGRSLVRSILYMAVLSAIRYNEGIKTFYQRLVCKGKAKKVTITACMRKLLTYL